MLPALPARVMVTGQPHPLAKRLGDLLLSSGATLRTDGADALIHLEPWLPHEPEERLRLAAALPELLAAFAGRTVILVTRGRSVGDSPFLHDGPPRGWIPLHGADGAHAASDAFVEALGRAHAAHGGAVVLARAPAILGPHLGCDDVDPYDLPDEAWLSAIEESDALAALAALLHAPPGVHVVGLVHPQPLHVGEVRAALDRTSPDAEVDTTHLGTPRRVYDGSALVALTGLAPQIPPRAALHSATARAVAPEPPVVLPNLRPRYAATPALIGHYLDALHTGRTTNAGPQVTALEHEAATFLRLPHLLAVRSGADALNLAARALGRQGARALLPSFTYVSTLNAVELAGMVPVFVDIDPDTFTMDPDHLAACLQAHEDVALVLPVTAFGVPPDLDRIVPVARAHGAAILFDNAHGVGVERHGHRVDQRPDAQVWSLHATKVLPATEGGLLFAPDAHLHQRLARLRTHGLPPTPHDHEPGYNAKMDELAAATARHSLARLPEVLSGRRAALARLRDGLAAQGFGLQAHPDGLLSNGQNLVVRLPEGFTGDVPAAITRLLEAGVEARRYFDPLLHRIRRYATSPPLPVTEALWARAICLPLHSDMPAADVDAVLQATADLTR